MGYQYVNGELDKSKLVAIKVDTEKFIKECPPSIKRMEEIFNMGNEE